MRAVLGDSYENSRFIPSLRGISGLKSHITVLQKELRDKAQQMDDLEKENRLLQHKNNSLYRNHVIPAQQERDDAIKRAQRAQELAGSELELQKKLLAAQAEVKEKTIALDSTMDKLIKAQAKVKEKAAEVHRLQSQVTYWSEKAKKHALDIENHMHYRTKEGNTYSDGLRNLIQECV